MVMKQVSSGAVRRARRLGVAEAKSQLSAVLRDASEGPTIIHSRGRDLAVLLAIEDYERLVADQEVSRGGGAAFLERVEALKKQHGGGVDDFTPDRLSFAPVDPFARKVRKRP